MYCKLAEEMTASEYSWRDQSIPLTSRGKTQVIHGLPSALSPVKSVKIKPQNTSLCLLKSFVTL